MRCLSEFLLACFLRRNKFLLIFGILFCLKADSEFGYQRQTIPATFFSTVKARLQPLTVHFSFSMIFVCFIDAQIHLFFLEIMSGFECQ